MSTFAVDSLVNDADDVIKGLINDLITLRQESQLTPSCRDILVPKYLDEKILGKMKLTFFAKKCLTFSSRDEIKKRFPL